MRIKKRYMILIGFIIFGYISVGYSLLHTAIKSTNTISISPVPMIMPYNSNWTHEFFLLYLEQM